MYSMHKNLVMVESLAGVSCGRNELLRVHVTFCGLLQCGDRVRQMAGHETLRSRTEKGTKVHLKKAFVLLFSLRKKVMMIDRESWTPMRPEDEEWSQPFLHLCSFAFFALTRPTSLSLLRSRADGPRPKVHTDRIPS